MYDELSRRLWECASGECFNCSQYTPTTNASVCSKELMKQAADSIEERCQQVDKFAEEAARLNNIAEHFEADLSEIREFLEKKRQKLKPQTNYDRIISKTPEELAYFLANIEPCRESAWLEWLKQEVE